MTVSTMKDQTFLLLLTLLLICQLASGFHQSLPSREISLSRTKTSTGLLDATGDPLRAATGIRPSLHPTTINAIADALKARAMKKEGMVFRVTEEVKPLDVAVAAGSVASAAIAKRQKQSDQDGMTLTPQEEQTIAGRILGVVMRLDELEDLLFEKVSEVGWIAKYNEWATFGTLKAGNEGVDERIKDDPLFCVSRSECLLALFLNTVEIPSLEKAKQTVPDESKIDFLDADRLEVLLSD